MSNRDKHTWVTADDKFCALSTKKKKCKCGNLHTDCAKELNAQSDGVFHYFSKSKKPNKKPTMGVFEAHHILSVSPLKVEPGKKNAEKVKQIVRQTPWCINAKANMIALPQFGHTVKWYCISDNSSAPPWQNLPQHDMGHDGVGAYLKEVERDVSKLWDELDDAIEDKDCDLSEEKVADELNAMSQKWRIILEKRGKREKGTHEAWQRAGRDPGYRTWILPFSMAEDATALRLGGSTSFPARRDAQKISQQQAKLAMAGK